MPYASEAQRRKFHEMWAAGEIDGEKVREMDRASAGLKLPDRIGKKKAAPTKRPPKVKGMF